jgi:hypothetical protein
VSLAEVLSAARALPREEQLQLARSLTDEQPTPAPDLSEFPEHLRHLLPAPGMVMDIWLPDTDEAGWNAIRAELDRMKAGLPE